MSSPSTSSTPSALELQAWPELPKPTLEIFEKQGELRHFKSEDVLFEVAEPYEHLIFIQQGEVALIDRLDGHEVATLGKGSFIGELSLLLGQHTFLAAVAKTPVQALFLHREQLLDLIQNIPEVADLIIPAFAARRRILIEQEEGGLTLVGSEQDAEALRIREFVTRNRIPFHWVERSDQEAIAELSQNCELPSEGVAVVMAKGKVLHNPEPCDVARQLGLDLGVGRHLLYDVAIIGAGPAGLAAAVYAASEGLKTVVIEDTAIGGQAATSSRIENYLGFPKGISGTELAYRAQIQALKFGARFVSPRRALSLKPGEAGEWEVRLENEESIQSKAVIIACGVQWRKLPLPNRRYFEGRGIHYAATELETRFCKSTNAVIVGGGNSAGQAAMFLSRYAECTYMIVRESGLEESMSSYLADRIQKEERIQILLNAEVKELIGEEQLSEVKVQQNGSEALKSIPCKALFSMIGAQPNTDWLSGTVDLDKGGYIITQGEAAMATSAAGVFAVGDVRSGSVKRVAGAVGEGSVVISAVHKWLYETSKS